MLTPLEIEDRAARYCHLYAVHPPVIPRAIAIADGFTVLPLGTVPPLDRVVRGRDPIYECTGRRGRCPHSLDGCDERDQSWHVMLQLADRELRRNGPRLPERHVERFARAVMLPADEFMEDLMISRRNIAKLVEVHAYVPEHVIRARITDLGRARFSIVAVS